MTSSTALVRALTKGPIPPLVSPFGVLPPAVLRVVARALSLRPGEHHQSAGEMVADLESGHRRPHAQRLAEVAAMSEAISVLFVDDEPLVLNAIVRAVSGLPFEVLSAASGEEALAMLEQRRVDVLVSDIDMPGMSGLELMRT